MVLERLNGTGLGGVLNAMLKTFHFAFQRQCHFKKTKKKTKNNCDSDASSPWWTQEEACCRRALVFSS